MKKHRSVVSRLSFFTDDEHEIYKPSLHTGDDAVTKNYLYQNVLLRNNKSKSFDAKNRKIINVSDPENQQDVATKNYVESQDSAIRTSLINQIKNVNKNIPDPVNDSDAVNKQYIDSLINYNIFKNVLPPHVLPYSANWNQFFEMDLRIFNSIHPNIFLLKGTVKIKKDVSGPNVVGIVPINDKLIYDILFYVIHKEDEKSYDFVSESPKKNIRNCMIDQDKRLIVYEDLKGGNTLYFNTIISV